MPERSAGILVFRRKTSGVQVFLGHMGGPFWARKDDGAWTIPKGLRDEGEESLAAARREFEEETGIRVDGSFLDLGTFRQASGKIISAWAVEADFDAADIKSNVFELEWPPKSGKRQLFPEIDRGAWFDLATARKKIVKGQLPILEAVVMKTGQDS
ncbi:MAG TPA: NUDIX domain-containing protein [Aestuariivirgaceae bacterium]|jgi:predicted NUDIX family NTP pyrophosphohydrolase